MNFDPPHCEISNWQDGIHIGQKPATLVSDRSRIRSRNRSPCLAVVARP